MYPKTRFNVSGPYIRAVGSSVKEAAFALCVVPFQPMALLAEREQTRSIQHLSASDAKKRRPKLKRDFHFSLGHRMLQGLQGA